MKINIRKLKPFLVLVSTQVLFACFVFLNELASIWNRFPGGNFPIEHKFSWIRVLLFCGGAILSALAIWMFTTRKDLSIFLPTLKFVIFFAIFPTLFGVLSNYPSVTGWCCEVSPTRYYGFPFSYMRGNNLVETLSNFDLARIMKYNFLPYSFFLNFLFWSNIIFVLLGLFTLFRRKDNLLTSVQDEVQFEGD